MGDRARPRRPLARECYAPHVPAEIDAIREAATACAAAHPEIAVIYLFGSVARGQARPSSDVDLGVVYREGVRAPGVHDRVAVALADAVARATGVERIDVVELEAQGHYFQHRILCESVRLVVCDQARRVAFEADAITRGLDFAPTFALATAGKATALRRWLKERHDVRAGAIEAGSSPGEPRAAR